MCSTQRMDTHTLYPGKPVVLFDVLCCSPSLKWSVWDESHKRGDIKVFLAWRGVIFAFYFHLPSPPSNDPAKHSFFYPFILLVLSGVSPSGTSANFGALFVLYIPQVLLFAFWQVGSVHTFWSVLVWHVPFDFGVRSVHAVKIVMGLLSTFWRPSCPVCFCFPFTSLCFTFFVCIQFCQM